MQGACYLAAVSTTHVWCTAAGRLQHHSTAPVKTCAQSAHEREQSEAGRINLSNLSAQPASQSRGHKKVPAAAAHTVWCNRDIIMIAHRPSTNRQHGRPSQTCSMHITCWNGLPGMHLPCCPATDECVERHCGGDCEVSTSCSAAVSLPGSLLGIQQVGGHASKACPHMSTGTKRPL
jgi:hypothetical protein